VNEVDAGPLRLQNQPTFSSLAYEPSLTCKHPQYASVEARRQTFLVDGVTIPRGQNIDMLVDAGFFHVGRLKHVKYDSSMQYLLNLSTSCVN